MNETSPAGGGKGPQRRPGTETRQRGPRPGRKRRADRTPPGPPLPVGRAPVGVAAAAPRDLCYILDGLAPFLLFLSRGHEGAVSLGEPRCSTCISYTLPSCGFNAVLNLFQISPQMWRPNTTSFQGFEPCPSEGCRRNIITWHWEI
ncbi:uncharacterized protein GJ701_008364 [Geothlypis trichas]